MVINKNTQNNQNKTHREMGFFIKFFLTLLGCRPSDSVLGEMQSLQS
jgi:hypothetical protein